MRLTKAEHNLIIVESSLEIPEASSKRNRLEKAELLKGEMHLVNQLLSEPTVSQRLDNERDVHCDHVQKMFYEMPM